MPQIAGELTDGTVLWMADRRAIGDHIAQDHQGRRECRPQRLPGIVAGGPGLPLREHRDRGRQARANRILAEARPHRTTGLLDRGDARDVGEPDGGRGRRAILARFPRLRRRRGDRPVGPLLPIGETRDELIASNTVPAGDLAAGRRDPMKGPQ